MYWNQAVTSFCFNDRWNDWVNTIEFHILGVLLIQIFFNRYSATEYIKRQENTTSNIELDDARGYKRRMDNYSGSDK